MTGRSKKAYYRKDNGKAISEEDKYLMLMLYQHQNMRIPAIAQKFSLDPVQVRIIIGKRSGGSCCG